MLYHILGFCIKISMWFYHDEWQVLGKENIPKDMPVIFTPNHQNALHDALIPICSQQKVLNSWVRSDVFKEGFFASLFGMVKMMPIYRLRDGVELMARNEGIIEEAKNRLERNEGFLIFIEASHDRIYHLRPMKKGVARLAFGVNHPKGVAIIPTSMHYDDHIESRTGLRVEFHPPIYTKDYDASFNENAARTYRNFNKSIFKSIKKGLWHIERMDIHDEIVTAIKLYWSEETIKSTSLKLKTAQELTLKLEQKLKEEPALEETFVEQSRTYQSLKATLGFYDDTKQITQGSIFLKFILMIMLAPLAFIAIVNSILFVGLPDFITKKVFDDDHYFSSGKLVLPVFFGLLVFPFQFLLVNHLLNLDWKGNLLYILITIALCFFAFYVKKWGKRFFKDLKFTRLLRSKEQKAMAYLKHKNQVFHLIKNLNQN